MIVLSSREWYILFKLTKYETIKNCKKRPRKAGKFLLVFFYCQGAFSFLWKRLSNAGNFIVIFKWSSWIFCLYLIEWFSHTHKPTRQDKRSLIGLTQASSINTNSSILLKTIKPDAPIVTTWDFLVAFLDWRYKWPYFVAFHCPLS